MIIMNKKNLKDFIGKEISVYVRYGFKKKTEETHSYKGNLTNIDKYGVILERKIGENQKVRAKDFFPWNNIDLIRFEYNL